MGERLISTKEDAADVLRRTARPHWIGQHAPRRGTEYIESVWLRRDFQRRAWAAQWRLLQARERAVRDAS